MPRFSSEVGEHVVGECGEEGVYVFSALFEADGDFVSVCDFGEADADGLTIKCQSKRRCWFYYSLNVDDIGVVDP